MDADKTTLFPAWRQAEKDLFAQGLAHGSVITDEWLDEAFGIKEPKTIAEAERNQLVRLRQFQCLSEALLEGHQMMLQRVRGVGYAVVPPEAQTRTALATRIKEVRTAMRKLGRELVNVAADRLTDDQRKENSDAQAKIGALRSLMRKRLKAPED
jgi:hypothetical protein